MTRIIVNSKSGRFRLLPNDDGSKTLIVDDAQKFIECLRMAWSKAHKLTSDKSKIGIAFYNEMSRMFSDVTNTQVLNLSKEEEEAIRRSSEMTIFIDPKDIAD